MTNVDIIFNSNDVHFRSPCGAVELNTSVHYRIRLPRYLGCSSASLLIRYDSDAAPYIYSMFWCGMDGDDHEWWECDAVADKTGIYWYTFSLVTAMGIKTVTRGKNALGMLGGCVPYQLTVYSSDFETPDWLSGGVIYQIFPDRFAIGKMQATELPHGRTVHERWDESPDWKPNALGKITNTDFFGGNLNGVADKLDYLASLGVTCIYLNPIFEAHSNHRYDTADYEKIDPMLGLEDDLRNLCEKAEKYGMRIILDGVFNHTGSDSKYFNREGRYGNCGAYNDTSSPYFPWYEFTQWPNRYSSWWGFETLPSIRHSSSSFVEYITGKNGIIQKWMQLGVYGWRLDVVDELSDELLDAIRVAVKDANPDALILGEVWEDASNKESYGRRRRYLLGKQLDSVMNYPFRNGIIHYLRTKDSSPLSETVISIVENYPSQVTRLIMNHIGTHDTERIITALVGEPCNCRGRDWQASQKLSAEQYSRGIRLVKLASAIQFILPGVPSVYYGDEIGMEGYSDPFNRACFKWDDINGDCLEWYRFLGKLRTSSSCLKSGSTKIIPTSNEAFLLIRADEADELLLACSVAEEDISLQIGAEWNDAEVLYGNSPVNNEIILEPESCTILRHSVK